MAMSKHMSNKNDKKYVRGNTNRNVGNMLGKVVKIYVRKKCQIRILEDISERIPEKMLEIMLEEDVRRYIGRYVGKECQKEC